VTRASVWRRRGSAGDWRVGEQHEANLLKASHGQARGTQLREYAVGVWLREKINLPRRGGELRSEFLPARRTVACSRTGMRFDRPHGNEHARDVARRRHATGRIAERDVYRPRVDALHHIISPATADDRQGNSDEESDKRG
jgi:hypothetical protein